ncbi:MAG: hypothetical protein DWQ34_09365 [Planctomycetota bacterium]|nr:MAG: hypothetical protein DWQ34_09365 [Planctomycetota bacterium]
MANCIRDQERIVLKATHRAAKRFERPRCHRAEPFRMEQRRSVRFRQQIPCSASHYVGLQT